LSMALLVRRLKISDFPALEMIEAALAEQFPTRPNWLASFRRLLEVTLQEEPEGLMIAENDGEVAGWAVARQRGVHPVTGLRTGNIFHLSVAVKAQRRGVGSRLLRECEAYLRSRGCDAIKLQMPADHEAAAQLFKKKGYKLSSWEFEHNFKK
ncbi:MAG: GNAT family N-acetyltransferase, partial [Myxococcaceae bacterium]